MTLRHFSDLTAPIGQVIERANGNGVLIEAEGLPTYAVIPLDDDLLDYLLERSPAFIEECAGPRAHTPGRVSFSRRSETDVQGLSRAASASPVPPLAVLASDTGGTGPEPGRLCHLGSVASLRFFRR